MSTVRYIRERIVIAAASEGYREAVRMLAEYIDRLSAMEGMAEMELYGMYLESGSDRTDVSLTTVREEGNGFMYVLDEDGARSESISSPHREWDDDSPLMRLKASLEEGGGAAFGMDARLNVFYDAVYGHDWWKDLPRFSGISCAIMERDQWDEEAVFYRFGPDGLTEEAMSDGLDEGWEGMPVEGTLSLYVCTDAAGHDSRLREIKKHIDRAAAGLELSDECPPPEDGAIFYEADIPRSEDVSAVSGALEGIMSAAGALRLRIEATCRLTAADSAVIAACEITADGGGILIRSVML